MDKSIDSIGSCSLDADSTDFSGNFNIKRENGKRKKWETANTGGASLLSLLPAENQA
jgi:hypothetical protein